jgi:amylosucrase
MVCEMLAIANMGFSVLRLDAVAFTWKKMGTTCENLDEAHTLIRAFRTAAAIAAPSLVFKSEAIVHPDAIARYIDTEECQLSYNPLLMAELWEASATKEIRLLAHSIKKRHRVPSGCAWVNYVRCHDDIGWTFADEDAAELGIKGYDHRKFLNEFYLGKFPGSFSRGIGFQLNPVTGDQRICGTAASLAGIEEARDKGDKEALARGIRRLLMVYGIAYSIGGIPLLYLGDEIAALNDYAYVKDPHKKSDSRWVHRPLWQETSYAARHDSATLAGRVFPVFAKYAKLRKEHAVLSVGQVEVLDSGHPSVFAFAKRKRGDLLLVVANFSESPIELPCIKFASASSATVLCDLLSDKEFSLQEGLALDSCGLLWLINKENEHA